MAPSELLSPNGAIDYWYRNDRPGIEWLNDIRKRFRKVVWLNPEPPALWGTGDSDMPGYAAHCDRTFQVNNLSQLAAAIDQLLLH